MTEINSCHIMDVLELCRLCLSSDRNLISILDGIEESEFLLEKIYSCLLVEILVTDEVSRKVCQNCLDKVDSFYSFRHLVAHSQEQLGRLLAANKQAQNDADKLDDIEAELERELNRKESSCWEGSDDIVTNVICEVESLSNPNRLTQSLNHLTNSSNTNQIPSDLHQSFDEPLLPASISLSHSIEPVPPDPGADLVLGTNPEESLLDSLAVVSLPFCVGQEEKCENPLDLRCNINSKEILFAKSKIQDISKKSKGQHNCSGCCKSFYSLQSLLKHINKHHSKSQNFMCNKCNIGFKSTEQLKVHNWSHKEKHECDKCPYSSYSLSNFKLHVMKHNSEYLVVCEECGKGFYRTSSYEEHKLNKHSHDIVVHKCNECGKAYHSRGYLREHLKTHTPNFSRNDYQCETCGKTFLSWKGIRRHMASAHEGNRYKCDVCFKEVTSLQSLRTHKKIHTGEKPYVCDTCGKTFLRLNSLVVHRRVHSGEKPYSCQVCAKSFSQRSTLNVHKRSHTGERPYPCHLCTKSFVTKTLMNAHIKTHESLAFNKCNQEVS